VSFYASSRSIFAHVLRIRWKIKRHAYFFLSCVRSSPLNWIIWCVGASPLKRMQTLLASPQNSDTKPRLSSVQCLVSTSSEVSNSLPSEWQFTLPTWHFLPPHSYNYDPAITQKNLCHKVILNEMLASLLWCQIPTVEWWSRRSLWDTLWENWTFNWTTNWNSISSEFRLCARAEFLCCSGSFQ
jgi:hypothetical protein